MVHTLTLTLRKSVLRTRHAFSFAGQCRGFGNCIAQLWQGLPCINILVHERTPRSKMFKAKSYPPTFKYNLCWVARKFNTLSCRSVHMHAWTHVTQMTYFMPAWLSIQLCPTPASSSFPLPSLFPQALSSHGDPFALQSPSLASLASCLSLTSCWPLASSSDSKHSATEVCMDPSIIT